MTLPEKLPIHDNFKNELITYIGEEEAQQFLESCRIPLKKSLTINTAKIAKEDFIDITNKRGRDLTATEFVPESNTFYIDRENIEQALGNTFLHSGWYFYIQEVAAASSAPLLDSKPWDIILDMAAAPWWKTSQLANKLLRTWESPWLVIANDVNSWRIKQLAHNLNRWGRYNTAITRRNGFAFGKNMPNFFDHILLDAPCSGEWTAYKSKFALKHRKKEEIDKICWTQFQLLVSAIKATKPWGTIVYSTCTINPYENEAILSKVLDFFKGDIELLSIETTNGHTWISHDSHTIDTKKVARLRPHHQKTGWFFISKIRKLQATDVPYQLPHKLSPINQFKLNTSKKLRKDVDTFLDKMFWIRLDPTLHNVASTKERVYLTSPDLEKVQQHLHFEKVWVPVLKVDRLFWFRPTHFTGKMLWHLATKNFITLTDEQAQTYSDSKNLQFDEIDMSLQTERYSSDRDKQKDHLLLWRWTWFSRTKVVNGEFKNQFGK